MAKDQRNPSIEPLRRGAHVARLATSQTDMARAQALRHLCFEALAGRVPSQDGLERDRFDAVCEHLLVEDAAGRVLACCRLQHFARGAEVGAGYAAQFYDLSALACFSAPLLEIGRFCLHPDATDPDIVRLAWGMIARLVDEGRIAMLFGCSSFAGQSLAPYQAAFDLLAARHQAPDGYAPRVKACDVLEYAKDASPVTDRTTALAQLPPLLRSYLGMGGWVSDHAVVDAQMNTLHVFTGLEIAAIPSARAAALRAVAAGH